MVKTDKHVWVVRGTEGLARAIDQIRAYRKDFAEAYAEAHEGRAPDERAYPEETVVLSPDSDAEPILWDYRDMLARLHVTCKPKQGRARLHLMAPNVFDLMLKMRFQGFFDLSEKKGLEITGPCELVSPMPVQNGPWGAFLVTVGDGVELCVDPRIAAETPEQARMIEDMLADGADDGEGGDEGDR